MGADNSGNGISGVGNLGNGASGDGGRMVCDPSWEQWGVSPALRRNMVEVAQAFRKAPTRGEAILWSALRGKRIGGVKFRRQQPIGPFVVDFYAPSLRLIVEVDGLIHEMHTDADAHRQDLLESLGLQFVRIPTELVERDVGEAADMIRACMALDAPADGSSVDR